MDEGDGCCGGVSKGESGGEGDEMAGKRTTCMLGLGGNGSDGAGAGAELTSRKVRSRMIE